MECEFSKTSSEEAAELQRSTKKVKENPPLSTSSYKQKLIGEIPGAYIQAFDLEKSSFTHESTLDENAEDVPIQETIDGIANVHLSMEVKIKIRAKWANSLIIKVFGRTVGFHFLHSRIMSMWKPSGRLDCVDLGHDFFLIRFGLVEDFDKVLRGGPWFIGNHYLSIRSWEPNFKPSVAVCSSVAVWARLPELPIEYYEANVLRHIGNAIGPVLRVDTQTASEARGRYARVCVQVDLDAPLTRAVRLGNLLQPVIYEGINTLCFSCGRLGHRKEYCPYLVRETVSPVVEEPILVAEHSKDLAGKYLEDYGPWSLVQHKKVGRKSDSRCHTSPTQDKNETTFQSGFTGNDKQQYARDTSIHSCDAMQGPRVSEGKRKLENQPPVAGGTVCPTGSQLIEPIFAFNADGNSVLSPLVEKKNIPRPPITQISSDSSSGKRSSSTKGKGRTPRHGPSRAAPMGNLPQRKDYGSSSNNDGAHQSHTNSHIGMVRPGTNDGMEEHLSSHKREPVSRNSPILRPGLASVDKPLVGVHDGSPCPKKSSDFSVEDATINITGANLVRIKPLGGTSRKEDVGRSTNSSLLSGQSSSEEVTPSLSSKPPFQPHGMSEGDEPRHHGAHGDVDEGGRSHEEVSEGDGMEFDGANEEPSSD
jgi:hypothetical protein